MKVGKAPGPSGIVVEMIRTAGVMGTSMIRDLAAAIICDGKVPSDWQQNFIVCLYKGKGDALERGNYRSLKLTEQTMKVLERIVDGLIRHLVSIDDSQFGFIPGRGTTDAIFVVSQQQEKYLAANKRLHGFRRPGEGVVRSSGGRWENLVWRSGLWLVQGMYANAWSRICVGEWYSEEFVVKVCVHQGLVLSPLLFIILLKSCHVSSALGSHGRTSMPITSLSSLNHSRNVARGSWLGKNGRERTESKCRKDKDHNLLYSPGPPAELRWVSMRYLSHWSGQQQHLQRLQGLSA